MIQPGSTLGHYEIVSALGKGGMGEVWRARDTKLGREVAIKTLPPEFAEDADRLARFEREARLLASLNHPNIAAIYGIEEHEGSRCLVLELVEGDTLADRLRNGPVPAGEALRLGLQIAEALEAAHEKGVIHRDLKPANIKVTDDGVAKVLDFGLAKAFLGDDAESNPSNSPTLSMQATQQGVILGTAAYMSPEQAKGRVTTRQTDVWAFGCVLYEMLTGRAAFDGEDLSEILAAVINGTADLDVLPATIHPAVRRALVRCLMKDRKARFRDIGDVRLELEQALADPDGVWERAHPPAPSKLSRRAILGLAGGSIGAAAFGGAAVWVLGPASPSGRVRRLPIGLPEGLMVTGRGGSSLAISPDGQTLLYRAIENGVIGLYRFDIGQGETTLVDENGESPFFSADGREFGYSVFGTTMRASIGGGAPVPMSESALDVLHGASWGPDNVVIAATRNGELVRAVVGGGASPLATPDDDRVYRYPQLLPGGQAVLFTASLEEPDTGELRVLDLQTNRHEQVLPFGVAGTYVPATGHLVFVRGGDLWATAFDLNRLQVIGNAGVVERGLRVDAGGTVHFAIAQDGTLAYFPGEIEVADARNTLALVGADGVGRALTEELRNYEKPRVSPDGDKVAVEVTEAGATHIWLVETANGNGTQLTFEGTENRSPVWGPDGQTVVFRSDRTGTLGLYSQSADPGGQATPLYEGSATLVPTDVLEDGTVLFQDASDGVNDDVLTLRLEGDRAPVEFLATPALEQSARISPDGMWVAYVLRDGLESRIFVRPYPRADGRQVRISDPDTRGNHSPAWSRDGSELYFIAVPPAILMRVRNPTAANPDPPERLFPILTERFPFRGNRFDAIYDVHPDGGFIFVQAPQLAGFNSRRQINIVLDWHEALRTAVPVG